MPEDVCSSFPFYHHLPFKTVLVCGAISSVVTPGTVEVAPAGAQAQHAQPATKQENILGCGLTHTQKVNTESVDLAISVVMRMMMAALLHRLRTG